MARESSSHGQTSSILLDNYYVRVSQYSQRLAVALQTTGLADTDARLAFCSAFFPPVEYHVHTKRFFSNLDTAETIFLTFFFVEMCLKIYGLGLQIYFNSQFNRFDFVVSEKILFFPGVFF